MTLAIVQSKRVEKHGSWSGLDITAVFDNPITAGNQLVAILHAANEDLTWDNGFLNRTLVDQTPGGAGSIPNAARIAVATKTAGAGESTSVHVSWPPSISQPSALGTLTLLELPADAIFNAAAYLADGGSTCDFPTVTPATGEPILLIALIGSFQGYTITGNDPAWTLDGQTTANNGSNSIVSATYVENVATPSGSYTGTVSYASGVNTGAVILIYRQAPPPPPDPGSIVDVYDGDDVFLATLPAKDVKIRKELNGVGSGSFKINRYAAEATAAILKPGNYVRVTIPQIDPDPIVGFFLDDGDFKLVATSEKGGEDIGFSGKGSLSYWTRAIWLAQSFLVDWVPAYIRTAHGAPPAGTRGAVGYGPGTYTRFTISGKNITGRITFTTALGFSSYYDERRRVHDAAGNYTTVVHLTTGGVAGWWVKPWGAHVTDYKAVAHYVFGNSVLMESIDDGDKPGQVLAKMYDEAFAVDRPINPIPRMTVDFDATTDSNGDAWATTDALAGVSAALGDDYLSTIGKLVGTGALDVDMDPDLGFHGYNALGRDLTSSSFLANKVRFEKGVNIADELVREFSDPPIGTFAEVLGPNDGDVGRALLPTAADHPPREISVRGDSSSTATLEALGLSELEVRLLHSDAVGFNVAVPRIGYEDDLAGLYLPGPPGSARGKYWTGDYTRLHTGTGENDFDEIDVRIAAISIWFGEAGDLRASVEVGSSLGGLAILGYPDSSGGGPTASGGGTVGAGGTTSDLFQLVSERDHADGYPSLDSDGLIDPSEIPPIETLATAETVTTLVLAPDGAGGVEFRAPAGATTRWEPHVDYTGSVVLDGNGDPVMVEVAI